MTKPTVERGSEILLYEAADGEVRVDVRLDHETVWLTQDQMGQLFGRERSVITKHVRNAFKEGELEAGAASAKFAHTAEDGKTYQVELGYADTWRLLLEYDASTQPAGADGARIAHRRKRSGQQGLDDPADHQSADRARRLSTLLSLSSRKPRPLIGR